MKTQLTKEQKEQIGAEIDNEGLCYWVMNYGNFEGIDEQLEELITNAAKSLSELETYLEDNEILF